MDLSEHDRAALQSLEEELWRPETRCDPHRMNEVFADDFFEFGRSGRCYDRSEMDLPPQPIGCVLPLPDFRARLLGQDVAQVTYNSAVTSSGVTDHARRSSIWTRSGQRWILRFHQGTPYFPEGE